MSQKLFKELSFNSVLILQRRKPSYEEPSCWCHTSVRYAAMIRILPMLCQTQHNYSPGTGIRKTWHYVKSWKYRKRTRGRVVLTGLMLFCRRIWLGGWPLAGFWELRLPNVPFITNKAVLNIGGSESCLCHHLAYTFPMNVLNMMVISLRFSILVTMAGCTGQEMLRD